jgi:hypothetical protein
VAAEKESVPRAGVAVVRDGHQRLAERADDAPSG